MPKNQLKRQMKPTFRNMSNNAPSKHGILHALLMKRLIFIVMLILAGAIQMKAQTQWGEPRELEDANVIIEKDREIELPRAVRKFEQAPPHPVKAMQNETLRYDFRNPDLRLATVDPQIRVFTIREEPLDKLYGNYVKLGLGNYVTSYAELFASNKRNDKYSTGIRFKHLSSLLGPVDGMNSGVGNNEMAGFGKVFTKPMTFSGGLSFHRDKYYFYGYDPTIEVKRDTIRQVFNGGALQLGMADNFTDSDISIKLDNEIRMLQDRFDAREYQLNTKFILGYQLSDELTAGIESDLLVSQYKNLGQQNRNLFRIKPSFTFQIDDMLSIQAGFNVVHENDTTQNKENMRFYPFAIAAYRFAENFTIYGRIGGDMIANTYYAMASENPYLQKNIDIVHANKLIELAGGIRGTLFRNLAVDAGFALENYKNMHFFVNDPADTTKFIILYDQGGTTVLNFYGKMSLSPSPGFRIGARGDWFGYDTSDFREAWHKPQYRLGLSGYYNIYNKIALTTDLYSMGGLKGLRGDETVNLENIIDLNIKLDYLFSDRFAAFLSFNNILSRNYQLYLNYPTQGLLVMGGISYSF
jgi:hypothetical protein